MIQVDQLTKYFGPVMAIDHITFQVEKGEIVGFLGLNGAGKTTTMRILTGWLPATSGIAKVAGYDVMTDSLNVRRHIGYLPESVPLKYTYSLEPFRSGSASSSTSARPATAESGNPQAIALPYAARSGCTPKNSWAPPSRSISTRGFTV